MATSFFVRGDSSLGEKGASRAATRSNNVELAVEDNARNEDHKEPNQFVGSTAVYFRIPAAACERSEKRTMICFRTRKADVFLSKPG
jgi:hypothetical protein